MAVGKRRRSDDLGGTAKKVKRLVSNQDRTVRDEKIEGWGPAVEDESKPTTDKKKVDKKKKSRPQSPSLDHDMMAKKEIVTDQDKTTKTESVNPLKSEVEFKFLLSDRNTAIEGLEKFIESAEHVSAGSEPRADIVACYCRSSQTCSELFGLIDQAGSHCKTNEVALVFRCLELILTRIRTDLTKYESTAEAIVQKILAGHMGQIYTGLQEQNKSKTIKACVQLITAMVFVSDRAKKAVQSRLNFGHVSFPALFRRRNRKDSTDVRSCTVMLTLAFLVDSDQSIINCLVQQKTFIQQIIAGLKFDRKDLVMDVLATLQDKVLTLPGISKTDKVKLFSETVLKQLCELYDWQGPKGWLPANKKKKNDDKVKVFPEGFSEDQEIIANVCHEFLVELCCSHKHGVSFYDRTFGTGQRNHNQLLQHVVSSLVKKIEEPRKAKLIIGILCACPDLIKTTLSGLVPSLTPRWSDKWRQLMDWIANLYRKLPDIPAFLGDPEYWKNNAMSIISMAKVFCLPPPTVAAVITQCFKHEDIRVRDRCAHLIQILAKKACAIRQQLVTDVTINKVRVGSALEDSLVDVFSASIMKTLPPTSQIFVCVDKTMQLMGARDQKLRDLKTEEMQDKEFDLYSHASVLLQVLGLYQTLIPSLLTERVKDLIKLIDLVGCLQGDHQKVPTAEADDSFVSDDTDVDNVQPWLPQLYLLKLLSETDAGRMSLGREGLMEKLLICAAQSDKFRDITIGLVCKMLQSINIFSEHIKELHIWLDVAMSTANNLSSIDKTVTFLARCLATIINNPTPYMDRMMEIASDSSKSGSRFDSLQTAASQSAIEAILLMDDDELTTRLEMCQPLVGCQHCDLVSFPMSPLAIVALDSLCCAKSVVDSERDFVSRVLVQLLHSLPDAALLARIVTKSEAALTEGVAEYIQYWSGGHQKLSVTLPLPTASFGLLSSTLMCEHFHLDNSECSLIELSNQLEATTIQEKLTGLRQILLYIGDLLETSKQGKKCEETIKSYLQLALFLFDHILKETQSQNKLVSSNTSSESDEVYNKKTISSDEKAVLELLFAQMSSSASENIVTESFRCVLLNSVFKKWLFKSTSHCSHVLDKKSPKRKHSFIIEDAISEVISQFVCSIIANGVACNWLKSELGLIQEYVTLIVNALCSCELSPTLQEVCSQTLQSVSSLLDVASLSQAITKLLQLPLTSLVSRCQDDDIIHRVAALKCQCLCALLNKFRLLIEPSFMVSVQLTKLISPSNLQLNARLKYSHSNRTGHDVQRVIKIQTSFNFEEKTGQKLSAFTAVFDLLPYCDDNNNVREFVIFVLDWFSEMAIAFNPQIFDQLFQRSTMQLQNFQDDRLFTSMIKNVKGCFLLFEKWLSKNVSAVIKNQKWFLINIYLEANTSFSGGYNKTVEAVKNGVSSCLKKLDSSSLSQSLPYLKLLSLAVHNTDPTFQQLLTNTIADHIRLQERCELMHFSVLEVSASFCKGLNSGRQEGQSSQAFLVKLAVGQLTYLAQTTFVPSSLHEYLTELATNLLAKLTDTDWQQLIPCLQKLIQTTVKHQLSDAKLMNFGVDMTEKILNRNVGSSFPQDLFVQCVQHQMFHKVMTSTEFLDAKAALVRLLFILGELCPACYKETEIKGVLVSAYNASLTLTDQHLLVMMERCSQSLGTQFECPTLWGQSALDHEQASEVLGPSLHRHAQTVSIVEQLNSDLMQESILNFPFRRLLLDNAIVDASLFKTQARCYDPSFLLRLFVQVLSPDKQVPLRTFVERDCLSYLLVALSSHDHHSRLLAYHALNDFYLHTDGSKWHDKMEMTFILDLFNASRVKDGQKLPFVVALFLARAVKLLLNPGDLMYVPIFRFLMAKPELDLGNVPEFYKLFFSAGVQFKHERNWMLSLLCDGMRETSDYWLYQKKFIFKILLSYFDSVISDTQSQELILLMLRNACKQKSVAVDLVKNHGLMSWLTATVNSLHHPEHVDLLCNIVYTLWSSLTETRYWQQSSSSRDSTAKTPAMEVINIEHEKQAEHNSSGTHGHNQQEKALDERTSDEDNDNVIGSKDNNHIHPSVSLGRLPKSTAVEMALVAKSLIWHLSSSSVNGLLKILQVLHGMSINETTNGQLQTSQLEQSQLEKSQLVTSEVLDSKSSVQNLLNLSPLESCLLLYHVSMAAQQQSIAEMAASVLKSKDVQITNRMKLHQRKSTSKHKHVIAQEEKAELAGEENIVNETKSNQLSILTERNPETSDIDKNQLFVLFNAIVTSSRTLEFI